MTPQAAAVARELPWDQVGNAVAAIAVIFTVIVFLRHLSEQRRAFARALTDQVRRFDDALTEQRREFASTLREITEEFGERLQRVEDALANAMKKEMER